MTYEEKLLDPRWQKKRLLILQRDNWKCTECGDGTKTLHVHHENYKGDPWDAPDEILKTLCVTHHYAKHPKAKVPTLAQLTQLRLELLDKIAFPGSTPQNKKVWWQSVGICESQAMEHYEVNLSTYLNPQSTKCPTELLEKESSIVTQ